MKDWLDNVSDEQIKDVVLKVHSEYDDIKVTRTTKDGKNVVVLLCEKKYANGDNSRVYRHYYNAFGEYNLNESCGLVLKPFDDNTQLWFAMVYKQVQNESINGLTYLEAFEQAHEKSIANTGSIKQAEINKKIIELNSLIKKNNLYIKLELSKLHQFTNEKRRKAKKAEDSLIVKDFLRKMNVKERQVWLEQNGFVAPRNNKNLEDSKSSNIMVK